MSSGKHTQDGEKPRLDCVEVRESIEEFALGILEPRNRAEIAEHLAVCDVCCALSARIQDDVAMLSEIGPTATPRPGLWDELERRVTEQRTQEHDATRAAVESTLPPGAEIVRRTGGEWRDASVEGVRFKILHEDPVARRHTVLYQMDPGTGYPPHVHGGDEECFVLEGDLSVGDIVMGPGDYQRVEGGTRHDWQRTHGGCLLFIVCSTEDVVEQHGSV